MTGKLKGIDYLSTRRANDGLVKRRGKRWQRRSGVFKGKEKSSQKLRRQEQSEFVGYQEMMYNTAMFKSLYMAISSQPTTRLPSVAQRLPIIHCLQLLSTVGFVVYHSANHTTAAINGKSRKEISDFFFQPQRNPSTEHLVQNPQLVQRGIAYQLHECWLDWSKQFPSSRLL